MVILGIGTNLGDRRGYLSEAIGQLSAILRDMRQSHVYECAALLPEGAPEEWNVPFLNMAVIGDTDLEPQALLEEIKRIERQMGRQVRGFWGPREIDIDILAMDSIVIEDIVLNVPHHELLRRDFALLPLVDVAPDWLYPAEGAYKGWKARDIAAALGYKASQMLKDTGTLDHD